MNRHTRIKKRSLAQYLLLAALAAIVTLNEANERSRCSHCSDLSPRTVTLRLERCLCECGQRLEMCAARGQSWIRLNITVESPRVERVRHRNRPPKHVAAIPAGALCLDGLRTGESRPNRE